MINKRYIILLIVVFLFSSILISIACAHSEPDVEIYKYPPETDEPSTTSPQTQPPGNQITPSTPADSTDEYNERSIVVDERNNIFSIGLPPGYEERREIKAKKQVDIWFEYLPQEIELEVDGVKVPHSDRWEFKINYVSGVKEFNYTSRNTSSQFKSYNLHIIPTKQGEAVNVTVKEWWSP